MGLCVAYADRIRTRPGQKLPGWAVTEQAGAAAKQGQRRYRCMEDAENEMVQLRTASDVEAACRPLARGLGLRDMARGPAATLLSLEGGDFGSELAHMEEKSRADGLIAITARCTRAGGRLLRARHCCQGELTRRAVRCSKRWSAWEIIHGCDPPLRRERASGMPPD